MRRLAARRLPHALPFRIPPSNAQIRFYASWPRDIGKSTEKLIEYQIPDLILDLDTEHNTHVRPYDGDTDDVPTERRLETFRELDAIQMRVAKFESNFAASDALDKKFSPWHISDFDMVSLAIDDTLVTKRPPLHIASAVFDPSTQMDRVLWRNGIPPYSGENFHKILAYMLRRQRVISRLHPPEMGDERMLRREFSTTFSELERLVMNALETPHGHQLVSSCTKGLGISCHQLANITPADRLLPFLHNLIINLESQGLPIASEFLWCATSVSVLWGKFDAAQKYMGMIITYANRDITNTQILFILETLEGSIASPSPEGTGSHVHDPIYHLLAIYSFLTGRGSDETSQPSILDHDFYNRVQCLELYVICLARLGAFRTLWHVWQTLSDMLADAGSTNQSIASDAEREGFDRQMQHTSSEDDPASGQGPTRLDDQIPVWAKVFADAIHKALESNTRLIKLIEAPGFVDANERYNDDSQRDIENIIKFTDDISVLSPGKLQPISPADMKSIFSTGSSAEALLALQSYISAARRRRRGLRDAVI